MENFDWAGLPGTLLPGGYEVQQFLAGTDSSASFRVRVLGDRFTTAVGEFFAPGSIPPAQVDVWSALCGLREANVSSPLTAGVLDGAPYFVEVQPDETLNNLIAERPVSPEEAQEVTRALARGLSALHANGFAQGRLEPSSIAAIGDRICLRVQDARQLNTPLKEGEDASVEGDVRRLGRVLFTVMTRRTDVSVEAARELPTPFGEIIAGCLGGGVTLAGVQSFLDGKSTPGFERPAPPPRIEPPAPVAPPPIEPRPVVAERALSATAASAAAPTPSVAPTPPLIARPATPPVARVAPPPANPVSPQRDLFSSGRPGRGAPRRSAMWYYIPIGAILLAAILLWLMRPKHQAPVQAPAPRAAAANPSAQAAWPSREVGPTSTAAKPSTRTEPPPAPAVVRGSSKRGQAWHVIAFTFNRQADAEKRAQSINSKHPNLHAVVFSPSGGSPYLIALGGGEAMTLDQAEQLRHKARLAGMPRDTYVQNYQR